MTGYFTETHLIPFRDVQKVHLCRDSVPCINPLVSYSTESQGSGGNRSTGTLHLLDGLRCIVRTRFKKFYDSVDFSVVASKQESFSTSHKYCQGVTRTISHRHRRICLTRPSNEKTFPYMIFLPFYFESCPLVPSSIETTSSRLLLYSYYSTSG